MNEEMSSADIIGRAMQKRRSMEEACSDLCAKYDKRRTPQLARMIEQLEAEITERKWAPVRVAEFDGF
jgi:hypothetical protein